MNSRPYQIHQIYYDAATLAGLDPAFIPLDNSRNERPDWREYWPMQSFLKSHQLDEDTYYGFFSPKFQAKTGLSGKVVTDFIEANDADVYTFSPFVEQAAFFVNVFEHGEANHPGLLDAMQEFVTQIGMAVDLRTIVCDFNTSVFSNYFLAKPKFWRKWLEIGEQLFTLCEQQQGPLATRLNAATQYHQQVGAVGLKVFMMERLVNLILIFYQFSIKAYDPFAIARSGIPASRLDHEMRIANALKATFLATGDARYIESYTRFRESVLASLHR
jgi:hypothetical protein